jgi:hypothetical protein
MSNLIFTELQNHSVVNRLNSLLIFDCKRGDGSDSIQGGGDNTTYLVKNETLYLR